MLLPELALIHDRYLLLCRIGDERFGGAAGGKLLLRPGFDAAGLADAVAASLAGAASLCVEADAERLREGLRGGFCDFVVAHLDEALRILKNELRRKLPVSVGLTVDPARCFAEMAERGLQPDLIAGADDDRARIFFERGAVRVDEAGFPHEKTSLLCWKVNAEPARLMPQIAQIASARLDEEREDTPARRRWLERAPRYLGRPFAGRQCLRMTAEEAAAFVAEAQAAVPAAAIEEIA